MYLSTLEQLKLLWQSPELKRIIAAKNEEALKNTPYKGIGTYRGKTFIEDSYVYMPYVAISLHS